MSPFYHYLIEARRYRGDAKLPGDMRPDIETQAMKNNSNVQSTPDASTTDEGWLTNVRAAIVATVMLAILVSGIYPAIVWGLSQTLFNHKANGSIVYAADGKTPIGSELLGQAFAGDQYFHPRPSAAGGGYDPSSSGGTNLGPTSDKLLNGIADDPTTADADESFAGVKQLVETYRKTNNLALDAAVPADAVTRSASGVDPHISVANARLQAKRVAAYRGMGEADVLRLVDQYTDAAQLGMLGDAGVNVLSLNLALDKAGPATAPAAR